MVKESKRRVEENVLKPEGPPFIVSERKERFSETVTAFFFLSLFDFDFDLSSSSVGNLRVEIRYLFLFPPPPPPTVGNYYLYIYYIKYPQIYTFYKNIRIISKKFINGGMIRI